MSTSVIAENRTEHKAWRDEGQECKMKVVHRGGKSQNREKGINRMGAEGETKHWIWWRPVHNAGAGTKGMYIGRKDKCMLGPRAYQRQGESRSSWRAGWRTR